MKKEKKTEDTKLRTHLNRAIKRKDALVIRALLKDQPDGVEADVLAALKRNDRKKAKAAIT